MDLVLRLFVRFSHNLLISNCCSYGIEESISETRPGAQVDAPASCQETVDEVTEENSFVA